MWGGWEAKKWSEREITEDKNATDNTEVLRWSDDLGNKVSLTRARSIDICLDAPDTFSF